MRKLQFFAIFVTNHKTKYRLVSKRDEKSKIHLNLSNCVLFADDVNGDTWTN